MDEYDTIIAKRIISLTPSLTEILFALDLGHRVCGVTDSCDYPIKVADRPNVGCWFDPDMAKLGDLKPDMVLGLQTAHDQLAQKIESRGIPLFLVNPTTVDEAIADICRIGTILGARKNSEKLVARLRTRLSAIDARVEEIAESDKLTVCRILDMEDGRFHVAGPLSFQYDIITRAGGLNVTASTGEAYPNITLSRLKEWDPQVIFNCGFDLIKNPALTPRPEWQALTAVQSERVYAYDCALTCRTGPRIVDMVELLFQTLYAET
ncbi:MAG: ABC transporter substrate-binding protein [Deltaproteobacteria bacterium]|jgi:iron complex transport system substrate-binding protein|nr:ABC transporter substrate-binding protein [Deltaproteobacteria bacterium]